MKAEELVRHLGELPSEIAGERVLAKVAERLTLELRRRLGEQGENLCTSSGNGRFVIGSRNRALLKHEYGDTSKPSRPAFRSAAMAVAVTLRGEVLSTIAEVLRDA